MCLPALAVVGTALGASAGAAAAIGTAATIGGGILAAKALTPKAPSQTTAAAPDPAVERAATEAAALKDANAATAADKRSRRANVLALGGESDTLGASQSAITNTQTKTSVLGGGA